MQYLHLWVVEPPAPSPPSTCIAIPPFFRILLIIRRCCILKIISDQYLALLSQERLRLPTIHQRKASHLKNQVDCLPADELRGGHPSELFLVNKPVEVDVKQPEKHPTFILVASSKFHHLLLTNLNAVTATLCQYWSLSLSSVPNWSPMFNCLMCRMKSFFLTLEYSESL